MRTTYLNDPEDCDWLRSTHLRNLAPREFKAFVLHGNEDAPERLDLYAEQDPLCTAEAQTYIQDDEGDLHERR